MPRWLRIVRGMLTMGLTFSAGVFVVASTIAGVAILLFGVKPEPEMVITVVGSAIWSFPIGLAFAGFMALSARGRGFDKLTIPRFAAIGAGAGLLLYGLLALNAWQAWSADAAIVNAVLFVLLGSGSATASLLLARRARPALPPDDDRPKLGEG
ncbi:MAG TPA: hypothetical protein VFV65_05190 [Gemmatimonadales bacterium]|nr:hypothetical protein [Gemmatimonadales bacterium]